MGRCDPLSCPYSQCRRTRFPLQFPRGATPETDTQYGTQQTVTVPISPWRPWPIQRQARLNLYLKG
jgi:hypothetical protein